VIVVNLSFVPILLMLITPCFCLTVMRYIKEGKCAQIPGVGIHCKDRIP
jgi:hypothetical protein